MFAAALERERKQLYNKGEAAGSALGMQVQRQTILQLLQFRFTLTEAEQKRFAAQLEQIRTLGQLSQLTNGLLNRDVRLEDFVAKLASYLPSDQLPSL